MGQQPFTRSTSLPVKISQRDFVPQSRGATALYAPHSSVVAIAPLPHPIKISQRDYAPQPKVGLRHEGLPWVHPIKQSSTSKRLRPCSLTNHPKMKHRPPTHRVERQLFTRPKPRTKSPVPTRRRIPAQGANPGDSIPNKYQALKGRRIIIESRGASALYATSTIKNQQSSVINPFRS